MFEIAVLVLSALVLVVILVIARVRPSVLSRPGLVPPERQGAVERQLAPADRQQIRGLLERRRKIEAIALVRGRTDASLAEAKAVVEGMQGQTPGRD